MHLSQSIIQKASRIIKIVMVSIAIGWLSCFLLQEILLADAKAESTYPTMNQDFGKLISYMLGKLLRTIVYIIVVIPGVIYKELPLPESFWGVLALEAIFFGVLLGVALPDMVWKYCRLAINFLKKHHIKKTNKQDDSGSQFDSRRSNSNEFRDTDG